MKKGCGGAFRGFEAGYAENYTHIRASDGKDGSRWKWVVRAAEATQVKHSVQRCVFSPCLSQQCPWGEVVPQTLHSVVGEDWPVWLCASSDLVLHTSVVMGMGALLDIAFQLLARVHDGVFHIFICRERVVRARHLARAQILS